MSRYDDCFSTLLKSLPIEQNREFELKITAYVREKEEQELKEFERFLYNELSTCEDEEECYIAFLCIATLLRRNEHKTSLKVLFERHGERFEHQPLYKHYKALMHKANDETMASIDLMRELFDSEKEMLSNSGVLHNYAESIITALEDAINVTQVLTLKEEGFQKLEKAIRLNQYAKFYATKARFLTYDQKYKEAMNELKRAIDLEEVGHDYQLRIARYYQQLNNIQVQDVLERNRQEHERNDNEIEESLKRFNDEMDLKMNEQDDDFKQNKKETAQMIEEMKRQNLQMLGFFTAIISFTVGTFQVLQAQSFTSAFSLIMTMGGVLLIAYAGFSYTILGIVHEDEQSKNKLRFSKHYLPIFIIGALMIAIAIFVYKFNFLEVVS